MRATIKPIRVLHRAGGQHAALRAAGTEPRVSPHSGWCAAIVARRSLGLRRGRWFPLDLIWRAAGQRNSASFSYSRTFQLQLVANFLTHSGTAMPQGLRPRCPTLSAFRESRMPPSFHSLGRTLLALSPIGTAAQQGGTTSNRHPVATRYAVPHAIESRVTRRRKNAEMIGRSPLRFTLASGVENSQPLRKRILSGTARNETAYVPVSRAFVSQTVAATNPEVSNSLGRSQKRFSTNFDTFEATAAKAASPQLDIHKLADEVIQQIDRRIVSTRERFGKR